MTSQWLWYTTRGAGVISLVLLSAVVCLGLLTRLRSGRGWLGFLTAAVHQDLALVALFFLGLHIVTAVVIPSPALASRRPSCPSVPRTAPYGWGSAR